MFCNRGIYHEGWTAVTRHSIPWVGTEMPAFDDDVWELYGPDDWSQAYDLAADNPEKLRELQRLFIIEAGKYNVLPLDDRRYERFNADMAGRPQLVRGNSQLLFGSMGRLTENSVVVNKNKSFSITAELEVPEGGAEGVIVAQGGAFGGFALYVKDGKPAYCYNLFGLQRFKVYGDGKIPAGEHQVRMEFTYDGGGLGKGGDVALFLDGEQVGSGRVDGTVPMLFSADETTDVGSDSATPVSDDYGPKDSEFTGKVRWVQIDTDAAADGHGSPDQPRGAAPGRDGAAVGPPAHGSGDRRDPPAGDRRRDQPGADHRDRPDARDSARAVERPCVRARLDRRPDDRGRRAARARERQLSGGRRRSGDVGRASSSSPSARCSCSWRRARGALGRGRARKPRCPSGCRRSTRSRPASRSGSE